MTMDIRIPIGLLFTLIGALLLGYGIVAGPPLAGTAGDVNVDAWWVLVLLAFGVGMLFFARRHAGRR